MKILNKYTNLLSVVLTIVTLSACSQTVLAQQQYSLQDLPAQFNSPASFSLDSDNNILFTSPNLHNQTLVEQGVLTKAAAPTIGLIDNKNQVSVWYTFKQQDLEPNSGVVTPMGIAKGPDGNIYIADMQLWFGGESRLLRVNVIDGKAIDVDVVAKGFSFPNAVAWRGNDVFISDTVLATEKGISTTSGVYKLRLDELSAENPLQISKYQNKNNHDAHLFETFDSNGSLGFGANGLAVDGQGNLYTGIMEDGTIYKSTFNKDSSKLETTLFNEGLIASDGIQWDSRSNALYITDLFDNAVYRIDMNGQAKLLAKNGNTDGSNNMLDAPGEVIVRGGIAYVTNFDAAFGASTMVNTKPDAPFTISVVPIK